MVKTIDEKPEVLTCSNCEMMDRKVEMVFSGKAPDRSGRVWHIYFCPVCLQKRSFLDPKERREPTMEHGDGEILYKRSSGYGPASPPPRERPE